MLCRSRIVSCLAGASPVRRECFATPSALGSKTAASHVAGLVNSIDKSIVFPNAALPDFVAVAPSCDGCPTNENILDMILAELDPLVLMVPRLCGQHSTALVSSAGAKTLDLAGPSFCLAKQFEMNQFETKVNASAFGIVKDELEVIRTDTDPSWRPDPDDIAHNRLLMELVYFSPHTHTEVDYPARVRSKRERGEAFLRRCLGNWPKQAEQ